MFFGEGSTVVGQEEVGSKECCRVGIVEVG